MWVVLKQIVKLGSNQLKGYSNVYCHGLSNRLCISRIQQNWLSSQSAGQAVKNVTLNPEIDNSPYLLTKEQEEHITQGDPELNQKLHALTLELYVKREKGGRLPETVSLDNLRIMLGLSVSRRKAFLNYLCNIEVLKKEKAKEPRKERFQRPISTSEHPWLEYRVHENCLFMRFFKQDRNQLYNLNALRGLQFGQKVIIDCSYDANMDEIAMKRAALQILKCYYSSRKSRRPFSLHICNLDVDSRVLYYLQKSHPGFDTSVPIDIHSGSYLELFDRKNLVYLSPHSDNELKYNTEDTYIIGAFVDFDTSHPLRLSAKKAAKENIRHAALPIDRYLKWRKGTKSLCINQCFDILLDVKNTGDWSKALQAHTPSRKTFN
ncbi:mitochondrial ribonuclease P protein 1 homolog [Thrips palmi]|uniref:RNA (guanine-9-)-methyltransferase domain-containing protein 1 n=1 Tax=Thrips palmi TaxID=161013 RepID=A0A6P9A171_THRPL|nr:mitochondrial ribonuclease P protein 1 homolog [Thrips palmi]